MLCVHPASSQQRGGNQHATWLKCTKCNLRLHYAKTTSEESKRTESSLAKKMMANVALTAEEKEKPGRAKGSSGRVDHQDMKELDEDAAESVLTGKQRKRVGPRANTNEEIQEIKEAVRQLMRTQETMMQMITAQSAGAQVHNLSP